MRKRERLKRFARSSQSWRQRKLRSGALRWIVTSFLIGTTCLSALEIKNDLEATNVAGSERMMAMRMLKDYMLIALKHNYGNPKKDLPQTMKRFESVQSALHAYVKDPATAEHLKEVDASSDMMKKPMEKFRRSLDFLKKASEGDPEALKLVKDLEKTYLFFSVMNESGTFTPSLVVKKTDNMLKTADQLTRRFIEKSNQKGGK